MRAHPLHLLMLQPLQTLRVLHLQVVHQLKPEERGEEIYAALQKKAYNIIIKIPVIDFNESCLVFYNENKCYGNRLLKKAFTELTI